MKLLDLRAVFSLLVQFVILSLSAINEANKSQPVFSCGSCLLDTIPCVYRFLWHPDVRHINGLLTLTPEFSFPVVQGWIVIPLSSLQKASANLPWLFLHVFLHYTERELNMCQTESRTVPQACQWLWGWAQDVELGAEIVSQDYNSFPLTIKWNAFQPLSKHN